MTRRYKKAVVFAVMLAIVANIDLRHLDQWKLYAAAAFVQYKAVGSGGSPELCTVTPDAPTTAGNSLAIVIAETSGPFTRTYTITDTAGNGWPSSTPRIYVAGATVNERVALWDIHSAASATAFTVTQGGGSEVLFSCFLVEWSGAGAPDPAGAGVGNCAVTTGSCDTFENGAIFNLYGSDSAGGLIDTSAGAFILCMSHSTTNNGGYHKGTTAGAVAYTNLVTEGVAARNFLQYAAVTSAETNEHCGHSQDTTRRAQMSFAAAWAPVIASPRSQLLGVF